MKFSKIEIKNIQKTLYRNLKKRAYSYEGVLSNELKLYRRSQDKYAKRDFKFSTSEELLTKIKNSEIIYLGDIHTLDQNTKNLERIFRFLNESNEKMAFGLEFIFASQQPKIENYLKNHITELEFLESINYENSWRFPWKHYKIFFEFSKKHKIPILALNSHGPLKERDEKAAKIISDFKNTNKDHKILVLFGELHIIPDKIPKMVSDLTKGTLNQLIIHQNLDDVFWKINNTENSIIKFAENEYSLQVSPPWIKYESMICWWENIINDPEHDLHEVILEKEVESLSSEVNEKLLFFAQLTNQTLELGIQKEDLENFNIYNAQNLNPILKKIKLLKKTNLESFLKKLITNGIFFKLPLSLEYYCPNYSTNKIAGISGVHLRSILLKNYFPTKGNLEYFLHFLGNFFASYLSVKIFNPYKKCDLYADILKKSKSDSTLQSEKKILVFSLFLLENLEKKELQITLFDQKTIFEVYFSARIIGYFLAEIFHQKIDSISSRNKLFVKKAIFTKPLTLEDFYKLSEIIFSGEDIKTFTKRYF